jgi:DNA-binding NarL/FixJ family response regulator
MTRAASPHNAPRPPERLDARERTLVRLAADGLTVEEIGHLLGLHPIAVRCLRRAIRDALVDPLPEQRDAH